MSKIACRSVAATIYFLPLQVENFTQNIEVFLQSVAYAVSDQDQIAAENVFLVAPSPRLVGFRYTYLQVVCFVQLDNGTVLPADLVAEAINENGITLTELVCNRQHQPDRMNPS